jgi:hypothetical protein
MGTVASPTGTRDFFCLAPSGARTEYHIDLYGTDFAWPPQSWPLLCMCCVEVAASRRLLSAAGRVPRLHPGGVDDQSCTTLLRVPNHPVRGAQGRRAALDQRERGSAHTDRKEHRLMISIRKERINQVSITRTTHPASGTRCS